MNMSPNEYFVEETSLDGYAIVWRGNDPQDALKAIQEHPSTKPLELWTKAHAMTEKGFAPLAYKVDGRLMLSHTFTFLHLNLVTKGQP